MRFNLIDGILSLLWYLILKEKKRTKITLGTGIRLSLSNCSQILFSSRVLFIFYHILFLVFLNNTFTLHTFNTFKKTLFTKRKMYKNMKHNFCGLRYYYLSSRYLGMKSLLSISVVRVYAFVCTWLCIHV